MSKHEFLAQLRGRLTGLSSAEIAERLAFYSEMIDDRMEEGMSEEEAVRAVGTLDDIVANEVKPSFDVPLPEKPRKGWTAALLAIGSPVWGALLIAAVAVVLSLYISIWAVVISLWAAFVSLLVAAFGGVAYGVGLLFGSNLLSGAALIGAALVCAGLGIWLFFGCKALTKASVRLLGVMIRAIKRVMTKKGEAK